MKHPARILIPLALTAVALTGCASPTVQGPGQAPATAPVIVPSEPTAPVPTDPAPASQPQQVPAPAATVTVTVPTQQEPQQQQQQAPGPQYPQPPSNVIGEAKAESIALAHAKVAKANVKWSHCALDFEDDWGRWDYECEFVSGETEYSYEIDAVSGEIRSYERDSVWD